jgi:hypothetical protein
VNITAAGDGDGGRTVTIRLAPADDPDGHILRLLTTGRLESFLRAYARPGDLGAPEDAEEARELLLGFAFVAGMSEGRMDAMLLAARDQWDMSWGRIARACDAPRQTVKDAILRIRRQYAEQGAWYDADGLHRGTPGQAAAALARPPVTALAAGEDEEDDNE